MYLLEARTGKLLQVQQAKCIERGINQCDSCVRVHEIVSVCMYVNMSYIMMVLLEYGGKE